VLSRRNFAAAAGGLSLLLASACGYHVGGKADTMPKSVQTIAVLPFKNLTSRYRLSDAIQQAISRELIARSRFQVTRNQDTADALLAGVINQVFSMPIIFDPATGKATVVQVNVFMQLGLTERATGKVLYRRPYFNVQNNYEIALNPGQYFDESAFALDRVSSDVARMVVSGILENF
jgi:hypothetical protein